MTRRRRQKFEHCSRKSSFRKTSLQVWKLLHLSVYQPPNTHLLRGEPLFPSKLLNRKTVKALHREKTSLLRLFFMQFGGGIIGGCGLVNMQGGRKWWWVKLPPSRGPPNTIPTTRRLEDRGFLHFGLGNSDFCSR